MNSLSLVLLSAEYADKVAGFFFVTAVTCLITAIFTAICVQWQRDFGSDALALKYQKCIMPILILGFITATLGLLTPTKQLVYMVAASEIGEDIINTDQARQIGGEAGAIALDSMRLLRQYLDEQLHITTPE